MEFELHFKEQLNSNSPVPKGLRKIIEKHSPNINQITLLIEFLLSNYRTKSNTKFQEQSLGLIEKQELCYSDFKQLQQKVADFQMRKLLSKTLNVKIIEELVNIEFIDYGTLSYIFNESYLVQDWEYNNLMVNINSKHIKTNNIKENKPNLSSLSEIKLQSKNAPFQLKMAYLQETQYNQIMPELINDDAIQFQDNIKLSELDVNFIYEDEQLDMFKPTDAIFFDLNSVMQRQDIHFIDSTNKNIFIDFLDEQLESEMIVGIDCEWLIDPLQFNKKSYLSTIQLGFMTASYDLLNVQVIDAQLLQDATICQQITNNILKSDNIVVIGQDFEGDIKNQNQTLRKCQKENSQQTIEYSNIIHMYDLQLYQEHKMKSSMGGLKKLTKSVLSAELDKFEQISCWENRPLRESQLHQAALDSVILLLIYKQIKINADDNEM